MGKFIVPFMFIYCGGHYSDRFPQHFTNIFSIEGFPMLFSGGCAGNFHFIVCARVFAYTCTWFDQLFLPDGSGEPYKLAEVPVWLAMGSCLLSVRKAT
jgi:hypothetical protein